MYDDLYGEAFSGKVGSSWAYSSVNSGTKPDPPIKDDAQQSALSGKLGTNFSTYDDDNDDDLFGD
ncbi:hypothetical protein JCGZ_08976 [Jatropha curcas]|nr:hypothetical protein JCGZ_08976 [Jatropha curcas]